MFEKEIRKEKRKMDGLKAYVYACYQLTVGAIR